MSPALPAWLIALRGTVAPVVGPNDALDATVVESGLTEVARLRGELATLQARLVNSLAAMAGRDASAALSRGMGFSARESRDAIKVAGVVKDLLGAAEALATGRVREGHLAELSAVAEADRGELLGIAEGQSVHEFVQTVAAHRIATEPNWRARQRASRSVRFFRAADGCVGMRAILPSLDGARLKARLVELMDAKYRAEHPERAKTLGSHPVDPAEQRMADALMELVDGEGGGSAAGRAAVIVVVDPDNLDATSLGNGPIPFTDAADLAADAARADVYAAVRDSSGAILRFGRSRRLATALQHLALAVRDRHCTAPGCEVPPQRCDAHHEPPFDEGGRTDVEWMTLRCGSHHRHRHETGETTSPFFAGSDPPTTILSSSAQVPNQEAA